MDTTASDFGNVYLVIDTEDISFSVDQIETNLLVLYAGTDMEPKCVAFLKSLNSKFKSKSSIPRKDLTTFLYSSRFVESLIDEICYSQLTNDLINSTEGHVMYTDHEWVIEFNQEEELEEDMPYVLEYLEELHLEKKIKKMTKYGFMRYTSNMLAKRIQNESTKQEKEIDKVKLEQLKKIQLEINAYNQEHKERIEEMKREEKKMYTRLKSELEESPENEENGKFNSENMEYESSILEIKSETNEQKDKNKNNYNILEHSEFIAQKQEKVNNILTQSEFIAQNNERKIKVLEHSINKINKNMEDKFIKGLEKDIIRYSDIPNLKEKWKQYRELRKKNENDRLSKHEWEIYHEIENWIIWTIEIIDKLEIAYCKGNKTELRELWKKHEEWLVNETGLHPRLTKYLQMMNWTYNNG
jgi:hypothetical protein